jgi:hypothetical protein
VNSFDDDAVNLVVPETVDDPVAPLPPAKELAYRKKAFLHYKDHRCVWCGFAVKELLDVAHLDCKRENCEEDNLALLCPTCHRMHDVDLLDTEEVRARRNRLHGRGDGPMESPCCQWCFFGLEDDLANKGTTPVDDGSLRLCPTCASRAERGVITAKELSVRLQNSERPVKWRKLSKDAGAKAGRTRSRKAAARRAVATRRANRERGQ